MLVKDSCHVRWTFFIRLMSWWLGTVVVFVASGHGTKVASNTVRDFDGFDAEGACDIVVDDRVVFDFGTEVARIGIPG